MGWRDRLVRWAGGGRYVEKSAVAGLAADMMFGGVFTGRTNLGSRDKQLRAYQGWVSTVCNKIAATVSGLAIKAYKRGTGRRDEWPEIESHPVLELLARPNPVMSRRQFIRVQQLQMDLTGYRFAQIIPNRLGRPAYLWPISPASLREIKTTGDIERPIEAFVFDDGKGGEVVLDRDEVWFDRYPHPINPIFGASPIQQQAYAYDIDLALRTYNRNFLQRGSKFDFALTTDQHITERDARRIKAQFLDQVQGPDRAGEPPLLFGGLDIKQMTATAKDAEFAWLAGWSQDMILAAFEVPAGKLGLVTDVNRANMAELDVTYHRECIGARVGYWNDSLLWLARLYDENLWLELDHEVPKDREFEHKRQVELLELGALLINEVRDTEGREPVPGGDTPRAQATMMPLSSAPPKGDQGGREQLSASAAVTKDYTDDAEFERFSREVEAWAAQMKPRLAGVFAKQEAVVLARLREAWPRLEKRFNGWSKAKVAKALKGEGFELDLITDYWDQWAKDLEREAWERVIPPALAEAAANTLATLGLEVAFNLADPRVVDYLANAAATAAKVNEVTRQAIRRHLSQAAEAGETLAQATERVRGIFDWCQDARAQTIARTEIANARRFGSHEALVQSKAPFTKEWRAEPGARDTHAAAARDYGPGRGIPLNKLFTVGGCKTQVPGHSGCPGEDINCRCWVRYIPATGSKALAAEPEPLELAARAYDEEECK